MTRTRSWMFSKGTLSECLVGHRTILPMMICLSQKGWTFWYTSFGLVCGDIEKKMPELFHAI